MLGGPPSRSVAARLALASALLALPAAACGGGGGSGDREATRFSAEVEQPLVPLSSVRLTVLAGTERDGETGETIAIRVESRVLDRTERVAGVPVAVVEVKEYEDGELVERTLD